MNYYPGRKGYYELLCRDKGMTNAKLSVYSIISSISKDQFNKEV